MLLKLKSGIFLLLVTLLTLFTLKFSHTGSFTLSQKPTLNIGTPVVVLDSGHGGRDTGTMVTYPGGPTGKYLYEKNVNLAITLKVRDILTTQGIKVVMTRTTNTDLDPSVTWELNTDLLNRAAIANSSNASAFVSIHANALTDNNDNPITSISGVLGTYFDRNVGYAASYYTKSGGYTFDPQAEANAPLSLALANSVAQGVAAQTGQIQRPTESHNYVVLDHSEVPSTLVEVGFMTNPATALALTTDAWQTKAATGIANGVVSYLEARHLLR